MRALILLLSVAIIVLAVLIVLHRPDPVRAGPVFDATRLLADARMGESATYRDERGNTWTFKVERAVPGAVDHPPLVRLWSIRRDSQGNPIPDASHVYEHNPTRHGLFPLTAPADPDGYDRLWVWDRIRRAPLSWQGREREAWRFDLIDPALPAEGGEDHVVAWLDESVPIFGLLRWQRRGRTWDLVDWSPR